MRASGRQARDVSFEAAPMRLAASVWLVLLDYSFSLEPVDPNVRDLITPPIARAVKDLRRGSDDSLDRSGL